MCDRCQHVGSLGIVGHPLLTGVMSSWHWGGQQCLTIVGRPLLAGATTSWQQGRRQCLVIVGCSLACSSNIGDGGRTTVARFCAGGSWGRTKVTRHCCAMVVAARLTTMPLDNWPSLVCSQITTMAAARTDGGGSGGCASNGGGNGWALSAVALLFV